MWNNADHNALSNLLTVLDRARARKVHPVRVPNCPFVAAAPPPRPSILKSPSPPRPW